MIHEAKIIQTMQTARWEAMPNRFFSPHLEGFQTEKNQICIFENIKLQRIIGFGGAFTEASAEVFFSLPGEVQQQFLDAYFDKDKGLGYTFCRTHINSCDFSVNSYSYDDIDGDFGLTEFSIKHDQRKLIPMIRMALEKSPDMALFASPWSPPAWMKNNRRMDGGGSLKRECYDVWARYIAKYIMAYQSEGIDLWGVTVQNEPVAAQVWESCIYKAEEEAEFIADFLGPTLRRLGLADKKILIWDYNKHMVLQRMADVFSSEKARKYISGIAVHWYSGDHFESLSYLQRLYPDFPLYSTEACSTKDSDESAQDIAERYAHDITGDLINGVCGWADWNLLLDEHGGPNHAENYCHAPIYASNGHLNIEQSYYYLGHFSRYIKPGSRCVGISRFTDRIQCVACVDNNENYTVVLLNREDCQQHAVLTSKYGRLDLQLPMHSITTVIY